MKNVVILLVAAIAAVVFSSCESRAERLERIHGKRVVAAAKVAAPATEEKVVIIQEYQNSNPESNDHYYKVKRIECGVVDFVYLPEMFADGDTVFCSFK